MNHKTIVKEIFLIIVVIFNFYSYICHVFLLFKVSQRMKIVYIIDTLAAGGGAERIISEKMNYLATFYNDDILVITYFQFPETMSNTYPLSCKIKQINLSIPSHLQYKYSYPKRFWMKWYFYHRLRIELQQTVNSINPDILIGVGYTLADVVCSIKCKAAKIIESHEARIFTKSPL